ncbi:ABC transporter permease [Reinekea blandensis]|uniref:Binding-protein-dependent transport systems inner membrane component n=1 Tax=Reinekea blandensis MED297 TaxID=314283 RepID=A4BFN0_9GAMM|nr:ABC transporter permease [Reinekea blandensis]EAR09125.1 Binding-protein-dependent transport systems inner membrane component [Reinekea sp. MED297] [Reinekea blandensis MED297]
MQTPLHHRSWFAVLSTVIAVIAIWYLAALWLNGQQLIKTYERKNQSWQLTDIVQQAYAVKRPMLPPPHQVVQEWVKTVFQTKPSSKRSLVFHTIVTLQSTLLGFALGTVLGILIAVGIVHNRTLESSFMPWVIASQTIPILAIAPIIVVVLGAMSITGIFPKAVIAMYLSFFPVTIGMVKGLRSADRLHMELMQTYFASSSQLFWKVRWYSAQPYLFASLKIAIASALVGAIVAELPTGSQGGLGARLLSGSYYGQTVQIWSALLMASLLGASLVFCVSVLEKLMLRKRGYQA